MKSQHEPLDLSKAQIRLVRLVRRASRIIAAKVSHFNYDDTCPPYEAISYTWGSSLNSRSKPLSIQIAGQKFIVGDNLYQLLVRLQAEHHHGWLWIDQICIDQSNPDERNHQVRMMHQIYTRASGVIAWLGDANDDSDVAMQYIAETGFIHDAAIDSKQKRGHDSKLTKGTLSAIIALVQRPYWSRLWILQEVIAAKKLSLMCGKRRFDWRAFERFFSVQRQFYINHYPAFKKAHTIVEERLTSTPRTLLSLLQRFTGWQCKDMRDKVYGLVGLVPYDIDLIIDYKRDTVAVMYDVLQAIHEDLTVRHHVTRQRLLWTLINSALQLRRNLGIFALSEMKLVEEILHRFDDLWDEAIVYASVSSDSSPVIVCEALLSNTFLRDREVDEVSLATGLSRRRSFHAEKPLSPDSRTLSRPSSFGAGDVMRPRIEYPTPTFPDDPPVQLRNLLT